MKLYPYVAIAFLTLLGINNGRILAQPCLNCWINPKTGQMESLERIVPRQAPPPPAVMSPPPLDLESPTETEKNPENPPKPDETAQKNPKSPLLQADPLEKPETDPQPLPRTQVKPRLRNEQRQQ